MKKGSFDNNLENNSDIEKREVDSIVENAHSVRVSKEKNFDTKKYTGIAIFSALAFVCAFVCNIIPPVAGFLSLDVKDAIIAIASFVYGPISAILISFIAAFIEFITFSTTGWYGLVMNFASSAVFSFTASVIYRKLRSLNGALISFAAAVVLTTSVMLLLNKFVTPIYLFDFLGAMPESAARDYVTSILPTILLPFNFAKSLLNSSVAMLLYKPTVTALRRSKIADVGSAKTVFNRNSLIIIAVGVLSLVAAMTILLIIW